jgi:Cdc6-like AAA superfamily ATPase
MSSWVKPDLNLEFVRAVTSIQKRAEKQLDWDKLLDTYVSTDLAQRGKTTDSQLVLGRRGTGKTHMFRVLQEELGSAGEVA